MKKANWKRACKHFGFSFLRLWIDSTLNSTLGKFQKYRPSTKESSQTLKFGLIFSEMFSFYWKLTMNGVGEIRICQMA